MFFCYRLTSEDLHNSATAFLRRLRSIRALDSAEFLVTDQGTIWGDRHDQINRRSIARSLAPKPSEGSDTDVKCMEKFINNSHASDAIIPVIATQKKTIPDGIPVIDVIRAHILKRDTWKYPTQQTVTTWVENRGFSNDIPDTLQMKEILIGCDDEESIISTANWAIENYQTSEDLHPIVALPFSVEYVTITSYDVIRLGKEDNYGKSFLLESTPNPPHAHEEGWFVNPDGSVKQNKWTKIPAKIYMGDGLNWMLSISFSIKKEGNRFRATSGPLSTALVQFLHYLPPLTGFNIKLDVCAVESTLLKMYGFRLSLPNFVNIPALAVLAGWKMSKISPEAIALVCLGVPVNHVIDHGDGLWAEPMSSLPRAFIIYMLGELRVSFLSYSTLAICVREEIMSDPDAWCYLTGRIQRVTLAWWAEWLASVLQGVFVDRAALVAASSRSQAIAAIRALDPTGNILDHPPYRIRVMARLLDGSYTIMRGGARFLHVERERAIYRFRAMAHMITSAFENITAREVTEQDVLYLRFAQVNISVLDPALPVARGTEQSFLTFHPGLPLPQVNLATGSLTIQYILDKFRAYGRSQQEGILEWARLNVRSIEAFFEACIRNPLFSKKCRGLYEPMRMVALRVSNQFTIEVPECEASIQRHQREAIRNAGNTVTRIEEEIRVLEQRKEQAAANLERLQELVDRGKARERLEGRGPAQPAPRMRRQEVEDPPRVGEVAVNVIEANRRGVSPARRAREQPALPELDLPPRDDNSRDPWRDADEDPGSGRAWCAAGTTTIPPPTSGESRVVRLLP